MLRNTLINWIFRNGGGPSFSQCGEDRIIKFVLNSLGIKKPSYLDIGAHHPVRFSNTYLFYLNGCDGVCAEPNPRLAARFRRARPRDICLNVGVGAMRLESVPFYEMTTDTLSTFSEVEAKRYEREHGVKVAGVANVDICTPKDILDRHFLRPPNFVSLDVEGLELEILQSFDLSDERPIIFCVETITYSTDGTGKKMAEVISHLKNSGYMVYADTYINTIFVDQNRWSRRR